ncbi:MAG: stage II sporulation protein M [Clostridia bacterium]
MKEYIKKYIEENIKSISILLFCIIIGLVVGIFTYQLIDESIKIELTNTIQKTLDITKKDGFGGINVIKNGLGANTLIIALIYLSTITIIAPSLICVIDTLKGFAIGIYIPTLFQVFGVGNGLIVMLLLVVIPNIVYIPSFVYICCNAINFHYSLVDKSNNSFKLPIILKDIVKCILGFSVMFLSVIIEQFLTSPVISIYKSISR